MGYPAGHPLTAFQFLSISVSDSSFLVVAHVAEWQAFSIFTFIHNNIHALSCIFLYIYTIFIYFSAISATKKTYVFFYIANK